MPDLIVTLTDAQWAAYQAVSFEASLADISAWLKRQLTVDYESKLEGIDSVTADGTLVTAKAARGIKLAEF